MLGMGIIICNSSAVLPNFLRRRAEAKRTGPSQRRFGGRADQTRRDQGQNPRVR